MIVTYFMTYFCRLSLNTVCEVRWDNVTQPTPTEVWPSESSLSRYM